MLRSTELATQGTGRRAQITRCRRTRRFALIACRGSRGCGPHARAAAADPKATVSYVVARDDLDGPTIWCASEVSPRVRNDFAAGPSSRTGIG